MPLFDTIRVTFLVRGSDSDPDYLDIPVSQADRAVWFIMNNGTPEVPFRYDIDLLGGTRTSALVYRVFRNSDTARLYDGANLSRALYHLMADEDSWLALSNGDLELADEIVSMFASAYEIYLTQ